MTKLAIIEKREGREMFRACSHRKIDYVLTELFKGFIAGSVSFILGLLLWFFYLWDSLNDFIAEVNFGDLLSDIGWRYIFFIAIYLVICALIAYRRHTKRMGQRYVYLSYLKELRNSYHMGQTRTSGEKKKKNNNRRREEA